MTSGVPLDDEAAGHSTDLRQLVRDAAVRLAAAGIESDWYDAGILATHVLGIEPRELVLHDSCTADEAAEFGALVEQRCARIPLQHLTGRAHFRHLSLTVGPGVFIPRPETEVVVEAALDELRALVVRGVAGPVVVDLCTGSGAIAAAIAVEAPQARVSAVELSAEAHGWAQRNLRGLGVDLRVGDAATAFPDLDGTVDVVISNPPYIPHGAVIRDPEVLEHDPGLALWGGGEDGLEVMRGVIARAAELLTPGGLVVVEHADVQGEAVVALLEGTGCFFDVTDHPDLAGRDRFTTGRRTGAGSAS